MSKILSPPSGDGLKKGRRRNRRAGKRISRKRKENKSTTTTTAVVVGVAKAAVESIASSEQCAVHQFLLRYQSALRQVPTHLPPKVHAGPPTKRVKRVSWSKCEIIINIVVIITC